MRRGCAVVGITLALLLGLGPAVQAGPIERRDAAIAGADRLLEVQFSDGALPWEVGDPGTFQNVQGITAQGFLDAYKVTGDSDYLGDATSGAEGTANWLADYMDTNPDAFISSGNLYFLAEHALLTQDLDDLQRARDALANDLELFDDGDPSNGGPEADLANAILEARASQGHDNLGLWDVALFVRGAQDMGATDSADAFAAVLADQAANATIVDPFDEDAASYELGLAGLLFGLAEADVVGHLPAVRDATDALKAAQNANGSWAADIEGDEQATAYAVLGLIAVGEVLPALDGCEFLVAEQEANGGWDVDGTEFAETDSEAVQALVTCTLPARNGAQAYGDAAVGLIP